jgi:imidazolonepropionase-like amidohydrolase
VEKININIITAMTIMMRLNNSISLRRLLYTLVLVFYIGSLNAQQVPTPAPAQSAPYYISGAIAHIGNGQVIENAVLAFYDGKITFVGSAAQASSFDLSDYLEIKARGQHLYPAFIAPATNLGLVDIGAVRATRDFDEVGAIIPNVRSLIAYNTDSPIIPTVRSQGILLAQVAPQGGRVSGTSSIVQLDAWNWEDAAYLPDDGIFMNWPSRFSFTWRTRSYSLNDKYEEQVTELRDYFTEAKAYQDNPSTEKTNLRFEAMKPLFSKKSKLYVNARLAKEILHAIQFAKDMDVQLVIVDGRDSWMVTEQLKQNNVPVILRATQSLPGRTDSDIDQPFKTPAILQEKGIPFCFSQSGFWQQRNLAFQAGQAVGFGLEYEQAIAALTKNTAEILGIEDRTGTLEVGKDANFFICANDVLDVRTSEVTQAFIQGRNINLDNVQKQLYRKFQAKYGW